jgi:pantothenate kinase-related protein Tda10
LIRIVSIAALLCLLVLVLYLPSAHPPERFLAQIRSEHQAMQVIWGETPALRILNRALILQGTAREATPVPPTASASAASGVDGAVAREMASVNQRLFGNSYFRAIDALVLLAAYRLSAVLEWLPWMAAFLAAAVADGAISRVIKSKEFLHHDPERFALYASVSILLACAAVVALVLPVEVHPLVSPGVVATLAVLWGRSVAHFHRRG